MAKKRSTWGSVRSRSKTVHELRYTVGGKQKSETFHGTRKAADAHLAKLRIKYEGGEGPRMPVSVFFDAVFVPECEERIENEDQTKDGMSIVTLNGYLAVFEASIRGTEVDIPMEDLTGKTVQGWLSKMTAGKARHAKQLLGTIIGRANDLDYLDKNVMLKRYIMPSRTSGKGRTKDIYSLDELKAIAEEVKGEWWEFAFLAAAFGGGQLNEATGVKPDEIDFDETEHGAFAIIPINRGVHRMTGRVEVVERTKNLERRNPLVVRPPYSDRMRELRDEAVERGDTWMLDDGFGGVIDPSCIQRAFKSFMGKSSFRYIPFGNLRNAFSTSLHANEVPGDAVGKLMRHSTASDVDYTNYNRLGIEELEDILARHML